MADVRVILNNFREREREREREPHDASMPCWATLRTAWHAHTHAAMGVLCVLHRIFVLNLAFRDDNLNP